jgi:hypothetical protein
MKTDTKRETGETLSQSPDALVGVTLEYGSVLEHAALFFRALSYSRWHLFPGLAGKSSLFLCPSQELRLREVPHPFSANDGGSSVGYLFRSLRMVFGPSACSSIMRPTDRQSKPNLTSALISFTAQTYPSPTTPDANSQYPFQCDRTSFQSPRCCKRNCSRGRTS